MATEPATTRPAPFLAVALYYGTYALVIGIILLTLFLAWPGIVATFHARMRGDEGAQPPLPTAQIAPRQAQQPAQPRVAPAEQPEVVPVQQAIDAYNATAEAEYQRLIAPAEQPENIGQGEPVVLEQRAAPERLPAGDNVPTAEPLPQTDNSGAFGSKSKPVNIQETHTCLHGQVWVEGRGCKNPTPVGAP